MSIINAVKAMMHDQSLPMFMLAKACNTTFYLQNMSPHRILQEIGHLRDFWLSSLHPHSCGEEEKVAALRTKGHFGGVQRGFKGLQGVLARSTQDNGEPRCQVRGELGI